MYSARAPRTSRHFYPRPPRGGRPESVDATVEAIKFLSTPSARRATAGWRGQSDRQRQISIHALREEGDLGNTAALSVTTIFLSTPSARRATTTTGRYWQTSAFLSTPSARRATRTGSEHASNKRISIHALREEGDFCLANIYAAFAGFLSTPSARRATAKTETKSLFSNKLYNILHEFRRALIYNGSKNYPNHAK